MYENTCTLPALLRRYRCGGLENFLFLKNIRLRWTTLAMLARASSSAPLTAAHYLLLCARHLRRELSGAPRLHVLSAFAAFLLPVLFRTPQRAVVGWTQSLLGRRVAAAFLSGLPSSQGKHDLPAICAYGVAQQLIDVCLPCNQSVLTPFLKSARGC